MNITTKKKLLSIAERMRKTGARPTKSEIQLLRSAAAEVQDAKFKDLLETVGNETSVSLCRQAGKDLLSNIRFATGARRKNDLPENNPRPEKIKRWLKQGKLLRGARLILLCGGAILFSGCASTQYGGADVSKLTDQQLVEELASVERELGIQGDRASALLAIDTSPRFVVTGASTTFSGNYNAQYNNANRTLYGSFNGSGYTTYQSMDMNAGARFGQALALVINASNQTKLENRRKAVLIEISRRRDARENMEHVTGQFLMAHPEIAANRDLLIACLLIAQHRTTEPLEQLQQAAEIMRALPTNRWIGWVEAHGIPEYPYGVVVGSYFMDTDWSGDVLTGKGNASDGSEMTLTAKKKSDGTIEGIVRSQTMEAKFVGRMTETALCVDYTGTEGNNPIRGITWAYRRGE